MRKIALFAACLMLAVTGFAVTYWADGLLRQPTAQTAQRYWLWPGQNMTFTYASNHVILNASSTNAGAITATNFIVTVPRWVDVQMNYAFSVLGPTAPSLQQVTNDSNIQLLGFDNNDQLFAQAQFPHNLAVTNSGFPSFYFEPHVHFTCVSPTFPDLTHSNVTWRLEWQIANPFRGWTSGTNQATRMIQSNHIHYILSLGRITNNSPVPVLSAVFRCRLTRPVSASLEYDPTANHHVLLDGMDVHVPVGNAGIIGSSTEYGP